MSIHQPIYNDHRIEYERPPLYEKQYQAIFDPHRYSIIEASTKCGKTVGCIIWIIEQALAATAGQNFWWVAPVSTQADIAFRRALHAIEPDLRTPNLTLKTITLMNGAAIWFKSADHPDSLYGEDVFGAVIDEASRVKEDAWHAVRTTLTATRGPIRIIGNVKGSKNWFYLMARRAEQMTGSPHATMGYHKLIAADAVAAEVLAREEVEDARAMLPENVFRELYLAEPSDDEGNPFGGPRVIRKQIAPLSLGRPEVWGWDLAKSQDWTVGIALDREGHVCRFERFQDRWENTIPRIIRETAHTAALVDSTGVGDPIVELLQRESMHYEGYHFTGPSKQKLMEGLAVAIQTGAITYPDGHIVKELEAFTYEYTRTGVRYTAPEGFHDDCVCALALAVMHKSRASTYDSTLEWVGGPSNRQNSEPDLLQQRNRDGRVLPRRRWSHGRGWQDGTTPQSS